MATFLIYVNEMIKARFVCKYWKMRDVDSQWKSYYHWKTSVFLKLPKLVTVHDSSVGGMDQGCKDVFCQIASMWISKVFVHWSKESLWFSKS